MSLYRRIPGFKAGHAKLALGEHSEGPGNGAFLRLPLRNMKKIITRPSAISLFFRHYVLPFYGDWSVDDCLLVSKSPPNSVVETTKWFASNPIGPDIDKVPPMATPPAMGAEIQTFQRGTGSRSFSLTFAVNSLGLR